jgi:hypothetical protein
MRAPVSFAPDNPDPPHLDHHKNGANAPSSIAIAVAREVTQIQLAEDPPVDRNGGATP